MGGTPCDLCNGLIFGKQARIKCNICDKKFHVSCLKLTVAFQHKNEEVMDCYICEKCNNNSNVENKLEVCETTLVGQTSLEEDDITLENRENKISDQLKQDIRFNRNKQSTSKQKNKIIDQVTQDNNNTNYNKICQFCFSDINNEQLSISCSGICSRRFHGKCLKLNSVDLNLLILNDINCYQCPDCNGIDSDLTQLKDKITFNYDTQTDFNLIDNEDNITSNISSNDTFNLEEDIVGSINNR